MEGSATRKLRIAEYKTPDGKDKVVGIYLYNDDDVDSEQKRRTDEFRRINHLPSDFIVWEVNLLRDSDEDVDPEAESEVLRQAVAELQGNFAVIYFIDSEYVLNSIAQSLQKEINDEALQKLPNARKAMLAQEKNTNVNIFTRSGFQYETRIFYLTDPEIETPDFVYSLTHVQ